MTLILKDFNVSPITGFLPEHAPASLQKECFHQWERVVKDLPEFIRAKKLRKTVDSLPEVEFSDLTLKTEDEWKRSYVILSFLGQAYIWMCGKQDVVTTVPKKLAVPWAAVSARLGVKPVINYAASVLYNYQLKDPEKPMDVDNLCTLLSFTGTEDECWFFMVHAAAEVAAGPGLAEMACIFQHMQAKDSPSICKSLDIVRASIKKMKGEVLKMYNHCNPQTFYCKIRPFVDGSMSLTNGLLFEGVDSKHQRYRGASAAQTSSIYAFDKFLGTEHSSKDRESFVMEMRDYMPKEHKAFLEKLEGMPSIREYCKSYGDRHLVACYNSAVEALMNFRNSHFGLVKSYIVKPSGDTEGIGTAGSYFKEFLGGVITDTEKLKLL